MRAQLHGGVLNNTTTALARAQNSVACSECTSTPQLLHQMWMHVILGIFGLQQYCRAIANRTGFIVCEVQAPGVMPAGTPCRQAPFM
jgi:hypothetical protein